MDVLPNLTSPPPPPLFTTMADFLTGTPFSTASPSFCVVVSLFILVLPTLGHLTWKDYKSFLDLGPGGTPSNFLGYMKVTFLRFAFAIKNPRCPANVPLGAISSGHLQPKSIPLRTMSRPIVSGIAPHRQLNQRSDRTVYELLSSSISKLADAHPKRLRIATSSFEKHCTALFSNRQVNKTKNGEIAHAHPIDGSLHMTLHPVDAKIVIENGWGGRCPLSVRVRGGHGIAYIAVLCAVLCAAVLCAAVRVVPFAFADGTCTERHPLARGGFCTRFVPVGFIMIYAPRTAEEVRVVMDIIRAGAAWVGGEPLSDDVSDDTESSPRKDTPPPYVEACIGCTCSVA